MNDQQLNNKTAIAKIFIQGTPGSVVTISLANN